MKTLNARHLVFGLMIAAVAVSAVAYAGSSAPWASSAYAVIAIPSTSPPPAKPEIWMGPLSTPDTLDVRWRRSTTDTLAPAPMFYVVTIDNEKKDLEATGTEQQWVKRPLSPGSSHEVTVVASTGSNYSVPATATLKLDKAPVSLTKPSVPLTGRTTRSIKVTGKVVSNYTVGKASVVKLKFYRRQRSKSGKLYWSYKKTLTAKRSTPASASYYLYTKLKPAGAWSVVAKTYSTRLHVAAQSPRSRSSKIR